METGRIFRPLQTIFGGLRQTKDSRDRDPQQGGQGYSRRYPNRQPTKEEIEKVKEWFLAQASIEKTGLTASIEEKNGLVALVVRDSAGKVLKALAGDEIFRLLESASDDSERGSILDRRI